MRSAGTLTTRDQLVLDYIGTFWAEHGYYPTVREIQRGTALSSTSVANYYLGRLEKADLVERIPNIARGLRLVGTLADTAPNPLARMSAEIRSAMQVAADALARVRPQARGALVLSDIDRALHRLSSQGITPR